MAAIVGEELLGAEAAGGEALGAEAGGFQYSGGGLGGASYDGIGFEGYGGGGYQSAYRGGYGLPSHPVYGDLTAPEFRYPIERPGSSEPPSSSAFKSDKKTSRFPIWSIIQRRLCGR